MSTRKITIRGTAKGNAQNMAAQLIQQQPSDTVLCIGAEAALVKHLARVRAIFSDADGTLVEEGHTTLPEKYLAQIRALAASGVTFFLVTGKPYAEINRLVGSIPSDLPLRILYEKGAYYLEPGADGKLEKRYLLSTPELEASVADLRQKLLATKGSIEQKYTDVEGRPKVTIGWAGTGTHASVLSIDILRGNPPANYLELVGADRDALKVQDPALLVQVEADLQQFVDAHRPGWRLVHLGNGNSEIAPGPIEKDDAIRKMLSMLPHKQTDWFLVLGDSGNDLKMFMLRQEMQVVASLVLHREKSLPLVQDVDCVSFGMANAYPTLKWLLQVKHAQ